MTSDIFSPFFTGAAGVIGGFVGIFWPFLLFIFVAPFARSAWIGWRQAMYATEVEWSLLDLKPER